MSNIRDVDLPRHSLPFDSLPYSTRTIYRQVRTRWPYSMSMGLCAWEPRKKGQTKLKIVASRDKQHCESYASFMSTRIQICLTTENFFSVFEKIRVHTQLICQSFLPCHTKWHNEWNTIASLTFRCMTCKEWSFWKASVFVRPHENDKPTFQKKKTPLWRPLRKNCISGAWKHHLPCDPPSPPHNSTSFQRVFLMSHRSVWLWRTKRSDDQRKTTHIHI